MSNIIHHSQASPHEYTALDKAFVVETDASIRGLGAVLQDDGLCHPVAYASRSLTGNYGITELETSFGHSLTTTATFMAKKSLCTLTTQQ